jgi:hypothetical protein
MNSVRIKRFGRLTALVVSLTVPSLALPAIASSPHRQSFRLEAARPMVGPPVSTVGASGATARMPGRVIVPPPVAGGGPTRSTAIPNRYIVVLKRTIAARVLRAIAREIVRRYGGAALLLFALALRGFLLRGSPRLAARIARDPRVDFVEQDRYTWIEGARPARFGPQPANLPVPRLDAQNDPPSWGLDRIDQATLPLNGRYQYPNASWYVNAYIIDSGIRATHREFGSRAWAAVDFSTDGRNIDCNGHGTHVAGTVGGSGVGVAKTTNLVGVRVFDCSGSGSMSNVLSAVEWVTSKGKRPGVVNMSLGMDGTSPALEQALHASAQKGYLYAVAAGNSAKDACTVSPASSAYVISTGATTSNDSRDTSYSNYGRCVDVFAPGSNIYSAWSDGNSSYATMNGTSMASPHVAGAAALVLGQNPDYMPWDVAECLANDATPGVLRSVGSGSPNLMLRVGQDYAGCAR